MRTPRSKLLLVLGAVAAFVLLQEAGYRIYLALAKPWIMVTPDGIELIPTRTGRLGGARVTIDAQGNRDAAHDLARAARRNVLVLGDSVAFGFGVNDGQVFTACLNRRLAPEFGFINAARPALDTCDLRDLLYRRGAEFAPAEVLWVYYINDARSSRRYWPPGEKERYRSRGSRFEWRLYRGLRWPFLMKRIVLHVLGAARLAPDGPRGFRWPAYYRWCLDAYRGDSPVLENESRYLADVVAWCRRHECRLRVALAPARDQLRDGQTAPQRYVRERLAGAGVPVLDLLPVLAAGLRSGEVFLAGDPAHWNARGHQCVADAVAAWFAAPAPALSAPAPGP
jgi:hypothetical protein